jgi:ABC-2 type transport system permease protein
VRAIVARAVFPPAPGSDAPVLISATPPGIRSALRDVDAFQLTVPGNAVLFGFFIALTVGLSFTEERKWGTWRRLLAAPVSRGTILVAKLVPYFLMGLLQFAFLFGLGIVVFGMRVGGSPLALCALTVAVVACAVSLGLVIAALGANEKRTGSIGSVFLLVMGMVGGAMVPRAIMPPTLKAIGLAVPHGWALDGYLEVLVREGATIGDIAPEIGALCGFTALFLGFGIARFRFER